MFITMLVYSVLRAPRDAWGGWTPDVLSGLGLNIKLGLAGIGMVGSEWWSWEIVGLATSFLGPTSLAAQSVLRECTPAGEPRSRAADCWLSDSSDVPPRALLGQSRPLLLSTSFNTHSAWRQPSASAVRLGPNLLLLRRRGRGSDALVFLSPFFRCCALADLLGAQKPHLARVASRLTIGIAIVCSGVNSILLLLLRNVWGTLFSSEPEIIKLVANVLPLVAAFQLWDGLSGAMGGVLRGAGKPMLGAIVSHDVPVSPPGFSSPFPGHAPVAPAIAFADRVGTFLRSTRRVTTCSDCLSGSRSRSSDRNSA